MNSYKGMAEIFDGVRHRYPVSVEAGSWPVAINRAGKAALRIYRQNQQRHRRRVTRVTIDLGVQAKTAPGILSMTP
jgi:hypothetical protein